MPSRQKILLIALVVWVCLGVPRTGYSAAATLTLGVPPYLSHDDIRLRFQPLADYLTTVTGLEIGIRVGQSYAAHIESIGQNQIDIAFLGPLAYVELTERYGERPILAGFGKPNPTLESHIVVRRDTGVRYLHDLKGTRFAFASPESTLGYLLPRYLLHRAGISTSALAASKFYGTEDNVAIAVLAGDAQAGAISGITLNKYQSRGLLSIAQLHCSSPFVFAARADLTPATLAKIRSALQGLNSRNHASADVLGGITPDATALSPIYERDFLPLRKILDTVHKADEAE